VDGVPAVLVTRWEWDGRHRARVENADVPGQRQEGLFT
jgi:hypothetical protein